MFADQDVVPAATPASPVELVHFTAVTATLSVAVPLIAMAEAEVEVMVTPGDWIVSEGGAVSPVVGGGGVGGGVWVGGGGVGVGVGVGTGVGVGAGVGGVVPTLLP